MKGASVRTLVRRWLDFGCGRKARSAAKRLRALQRRGEIVLIDMGDGVAVLGGPSYYARVGDEAWLCGAGA